MRHELKSWRDYYEANLSGVKRFEVRLNDRGFAVGDELLLREFDPETEQYSGREALYVVTYVMDGASDVISRGVDPEFVVMSIRLLEFRPDAGRTYIARRSL